jgi:segregation and condensation protein B
MSSKNSKKRRRIVTTSDIVPAGTREDVAPETIEERALAPLVEEPATGPAPEASAVASAADAEESIFVAPRDDRKEPQKLVKFTRKGKKSPVTVEDTPPAEKNEGDAADGEEAQTASVEERRPSRKKRASAKSEVEDRGGAESAEDDESAVDERAASEDAEDDESEAERAEEERVEDDEERAEEGAGVDADGADDESADDHEAGAERRDGDEARRADEDDEDGGEPPTVVDAGVHTLSDERREDGDATSGVPSAEQSGGAESRDASGENAGQWPQGSLFSDEGADDEATEPAAQGDELWTPEEGDGPATTVPAVDVSRAHLKGLIEALVFVADQPLTINEIAKAAGKADRKMVKSLVDELRQEYGRRGIHLDEVAGGLIFRTNPAYGPFIRDAAAKKPVRMTRAQLETLAIIAYRQPLTRPEVDEIRGVDSGPVMKMLLERDLVKILGKKDEPGRPLLYGTTQAFLEFFGLKALKDLPSLREFTELSDDSRKTFEREMGDADVPTQPDLSTLAAAASTAGTTEADGVASQTDPSALASDAGVDSDVEPPTVRAETIGDASDASDVESASGRATDENAEVTSESAPEDDGEDENVVQAADDDAAEEDPSDEERLAAGSDAEEEGSPSDDQATEHGEAEASADDADDDDDDAADDDDDDADDDDDDADDDDDDADDDDDDADDDDDDADDDDDDADDDDDDADDDAEASADADGEIESSIEGTDADADDGDPSGGDEPSEEQDVARDDAEAGGGASDDEREASADDGEGRDESDAPEPEEV